MVKREKKKQSARKIPVTIYQLRPRLGTRYSGTCQVRYLGFNSGICLFDKQSYILYSDYNIKNKNIGEVAERLKAAGC